jgi:hypothetical protein
MIAAVLEQWHRIAYRIQPITGQSQVTLTIIHTWKPAFFSNVAILCTKPKAEKTCNKFENKSELPEFTSISSPTKNLKLILECS